MQETLGFFIGAGFAVVVAVVFLYRRYMRKKAFEDADAIVPTVRHIRPPDKYRNDDARLP